MRVLLLSLIFSILIPFSSFAFQIHGNLPENLKEIIMAHHDKLGADGISELLDNNNINLYHFKNGDLYIEAGLVVKSISFKGNFYFLKHQLMGVIGLYPNDLYSQEKLEIARINLIEFYRSKGFHDVDITYTALDGDIVYKIDAGMKQIITDLKILGLENELKIKLDEELIFNKDNIDIIKDKLKLKLKKAGYFNSKIIVKYEKNKRYPIYFDSNNLFQSFLSFMKMGHQGITLKFIVAKGEKYSIVVTNDIGTELDDLIRNIIYEKLDKINIFSFRNLEYSLEVVIKETFEIESNVRVSIKDNVILVDVTTKNKIDILEVEIEYKKLSKNSFIPEKNIVKGKEDAFIKNLKAILKKQGYYKPKLISKKYEEKATVLKEIQKKIKDKVNLDVSIKKLENMEFFNKTKEIVIFKIDEGPRYKVANNIINGKKYKVNSKLFADDTGIEKSKKLLSKELGKKFYFNYLIIDKIQGNDDNTVDIYYKNTLKTYNVIGVNVNNSNVQNIVNYRFFSDDKKLTTEKYINIKKFLNSQKAILSHRLKLIKVDNNNVIISIYLIYREPNSLYGGISYDSVDKLSFYIGYTRYNIFNSAHDMNILVASSFREQFAGISLYSSNFYFTDVTNIVELSTKTRDEDDYSYDTNKLKLRLSYDYFNSVFTSDLYYETIKTRDEDYDNEILNRINDNFKNVGMSFIYNYNHYDNMLEPKNGFGIKLVSNPVYSMDDEDYFVINTITYSVYYTIFKKWTTSFRNEIGKIDGDDGVIPLTYRYTLGGPYRMRAYDYREIGASDSRDKIYGGKRLFYLEVNENYSINKFLSVGAFFEAGQAENTYSKDYFQKDAGVYFGVDTPLGQLKLSFAADTEDNSKNAFYIIFGTSIP